MLYVSLGMLVADLGSQHDLMLAVHEFHVNSLNVVFDCLENRSSCSTCKGAVRMIIGALVSVKSSHLDGVNLEFIYLRPRFMSIRPCLVSVLGR